MIKVRNFSIKVLFILLLASLFSACTVPKNAMGPFIKTASIETELKKGVSTKKDVQRYLGAPQGFGGAVFPFTAEHHDVWFYQNIKIDNIQSRDFDMNQDVLLVFFSNNLFDGFLWFTGTVKGAIQ